MRILLIGEFSRLHNSLKEGLIANGHEVLLVSNGDGFKNYPSDISTRATFCAGSIGSFIKKMVFRLFQFDLMKFEHGVRFYFRLNQLKNFDVVQFINESAIQTQPAFERYLISKIVSNNKKCFLLCCGPDYLVTQYLVSKKERYSIMNPYFEKEESKKEYRFIFDFLSKGHIKLHEFIYSQTKGVLASDIDYHLPLKGHNHYLGLIPNPINTTKNPYITTIFEGTIRIFLGINRSTYYTKGISFFEEALTIIQKKYGPLVDITIAENVPYGTYIKQYNSCHILLDQVYGYDQGYNALEAMAKGKVVFTGAEKEFYEYYNLHEKVAINALPSVDEIVEELSKLIENPKEIEAMGLRARAFVEKHHQHLMIAEKYLLVWNSN